MKNRDISSVDNMKKVSVLNAVKYIIVIAIVAAIVICWPYLRGVTVEDIVSYTPENQALAFFVFMLVYVVKSFTFVMPLAVIYIASGIVFPPFLAVLVNLCGLFLGASVMFRLGSFLGKDAVVRLAGKSERVRDVMERSSSGGGRLIFIVRLIPIFPADLLSLFCGASGIRFWPFAIGSVLGFLPGIIPFTIMGDTSFSVLSARFLVPLIIYILITVAAIIAYYARIRREAANRKH